MKKNIIVKFRDSDHSYWNGKTKYVSVNKLLADFGFYFNREYWLVHKGLQLGIPNFYKKFFSRGFNFDSNMPSEVELADSFERELDSLGLCLGELTATVNDEWELSSTNGTDFHNAREDEAYEQGFINNPYDGKNYIIQEKPKLVKGYDNIINTDFLKNLEDGAYAELIITSPNHKVAGQSDETFIETVEGIRYVDIGDHKTNKKEPKDDKKNGTCLHPIEHLNDSTYTKYQLQVSMYAYILSMYGYVVRNVGFYHYKNYDPKTKKVLKLNYLGKECEDILYTYKENVLT